MRSLQPLRPSVQPPHKRPARQTHGTCRLTLNINGTSYTVTPIQADGFAATRAFRLRKTDGSVYDVVLTIHGLTCDCPDFVFHRDGIDMDGCKHLKSLIAAGLLDHGSPRQRPSRPRHETNPDLSLAEKVDREADAYRALGTPVGELFAKVMDELATKIRMTKATTPDEYEGRIEILDREIRDQWEAIGYEEGRSAGCRCGENPLA